MSRRPKIANQPQKTPLTPEAQDIKQAIQQTQLYPIEQVVYLTDTGHVQHTPGTNRYTIPFPETWRTLTNTELYIGVRSIGLHNALSRRLPVGLTCYATFWYWPRPTTECVTTSATIVWEHAYESEPNVITWAVEWTSQLDALIANLKSKTPAGTFKWDRYKWFYQHDIEKKQHVLSMHIIDENGEIIDRINKQSVTFRWEITYLDAIEAVETTTIIEDPEWHLQTSLATVRFPDSFASYNEYLLSASFVNQTRWNYLGFTNTVFNPPKVYKINHNDTHYWIELASPDGTEERELPVDGKDFITLEIQLIAQPISHRL